MTKATDHLTVTPVQLSAIAESVPQDRPLAAVDGLAGADPPDGLQRRLAGLYGDVALPRRNKCSAGPISLFSLRKSC